jgi:hypothetical protein
MKRILQNKQYQFVACVIAAIILMFLVSSFKTTTKVVRVHTYVSKDIRVIQKDILDWTGYGYEVTALVSQGIAETNTYDGRHYYMEGSSYHLTKSDILLVMSKRE